MAEKKSPSPEYGDIFHMDMAPPPPYSSEVIATTVVPSPPPYVPPLNVAPALPKMSWLERNSMNKPQSNSVGAAALLFIIAGMNMSWCAYSSMTNNSIDWFIGAISGAILGALINSMINRRYLIMLAAALCVIDGIIYMAASRSYAAVSAARYFDGLAIGVVFVPTMVLVGEESVKELRGMLASSIELMCFYIGIGIQASFNQTVANSYPINAIQIQGMMNVIFALMAIIIVAVCYIESPVHHLQRGEEELAIDCLRRLQTPLMVTTKTYEQLRDHKAYIEENKNAMPVQSMKEALPALGLLIFYRSWVAISYSAVTYAAILQASNDGLVILYSNLSFIAALIVCFLMDSIGRKKPSMASAFTSSWLAIIIALFQDNANFFHISLQTRFVIITWLLMAFQFFAAFSTLASSVYLTEAFPLSIKPYCIGLPFIVQMIVQVIINCTYNGSSCAPYFYVAGVISMAMAGLLAFVLPETKKTTLLSAQNMFKNVCKRK